MAARQKKKKSIYPIPGFAYAEHPGVIQNLEEIGCVSIIWISGKGQPPPVDGGFGDVGSGTPRYTLLPRAAIQQ